MEEFSSVFYGHTPLVDFFPQYQYLYPLLFVPYFKLFGLSIFTFTLLMTILSGIGLIFAYYVLFKFTRNAIGASLLFIAFLSASFYPVSPYLTGPAERNYFFNYYAFSPLRTLGPWMVFYLFIRYLSKRSTGNIIALFTTASILFVGNVEFGIASFASALIGFFVTIENKLIPSKKVFYKFLSLIVIILIGVFSFYISFLYLKSGKLPEIASWFSYQIVFAKLGFAMIPMKNFGIHYYLFLTFGAAVTWGVLGLANPNLQMSEDKIERQNRLAAILFSGVLGFGVSVYFVGRSHQWVLPCLFTFWMFTLCLLLWEAHLEWKNSISKLKLIEKIIYFIPTNILIFMFCLFVPQVFDYVPLSDQVNRLKYQDSDLINIKQSLVSYIKSHNHENDALMVIFPYGHQLANEAGFYNEYPYAHQSSLLLKHHLEKVNEVIVKKNIKKIFGTITNDLKDELLKLGFKQKESFFIPSNILSLIEMKVFSYWER